MGYSLTTIWYERQRFLPAILAVAFSALLVAVQSGLVLGLLEDSHHPVLSLYGRLERILPLKQKGR